ncbi:MAG: hypothetical protein ACYC7E_06490 [Armatimonadota bacterium]
MHAVIFHGGTRDDTGLAICRQFAHEAGLRWSGGLAIGGGGALGGQPLAQRSGMVRHITDAFDMVIAALQSGLEIPEEAFALARKPLMPGWMYFSMANLSMYKAAMDNHVLRRIHAQPYQRTR